MAVTVLNYYFNATSVTNPDETYSIQFPLATHTPGGGPGYLPDFNVDFQDSIKLNGGSGLVTDALPLVYLFELNNNLATWDRFRFQVIFQCPPAFQGNRVLFYVTTGGPFIILRLVGDGGSIHLSGATSSWGTSIDKIPDLKPGIWYHTDLIYDHDTLFVLLEGNVIGVQGYGKYARRARLMSQPAELRIGGGGGLGPDDRNFEGSIAAFFMEVGGFQQNLETRTDYARLTAEWYMKTRFASFGRDISPTSPVEFDHHTFAWKQDYSDDIAVMYHSNASVAYTMSGKVLEFYRKFLDDDQRNVLGHLMCDQVEDGEKNEIATFSNGAIYKPYDGATTFMHGQLYLDYQASGGRRVWGFPTQQPRTIHGGTSQELQYASFFLKDKGVSAHAVRGDILTNYNLNPENWGFPIVDEMDVYISGFSSGLNKMSEFEFCTVYSTPTTGTHAIFEPIRKFYDSMGGPTVLGFPRIDQKPVEGSNANMQVFNENIIWTDGTGSGSTILILPFSLFLQSIDTTKQGASDNKPYAETSISYLVGATGVQTLLSSAKLPVGHDNFGWDNSFSGINTAFSSQLVIKDNSDSMIVRVRIMDDDTIDNDDLLGEYRFTLNAGNAWGYNNPNLRLNSGPLPDHVTNISIELRPAAGPSVPDDVTTFWVMPNEATQPLTDSDFSHAFIDLSDARSVQPLEEVKDAFYELAVRDMAVTGNCFGMCQEAILASKFISHFNFVLGQYANLGEVIQDWNLKQQYQAGAAAWWWWVDQVITPHSLSPVNVFKMTQEKYLRGCRPVLTIWDTSLDDNKAHCVYPIHWRGAPGNFVEIEVLDPMTGHAPSRGVIKINLINDTFEYQYWRSNRGSQLHYIPWDLVNRAPRTGTWEQMLCTFDGTVIAMTGDLFTKRITDHDGYDISAFGDRARQTLDAGRRLEGHFARLPVYMSGQFPGEILLSRGVAPLGKQDLGGLAPGANPVDLPIQLADVSEPLFPLQRLESLQTTRPGNFKHTLIGQKKDGNNKLQYFAKSNLCHLTVKCDLYPEEEMQIWSKDIGTTNARYTIVNTRPKLVQVQLLHRMGFAEGGNNKNDYTSVTIDLQWKSPGRLIIAAVPGLVRFELFPSATGILDQASIKIVSVFERKIREREHTLDFDFLDGVRFKLNPALLDEEIIVAQLVHTGSGDAIVQSVAYF